ncbi:hypothetical protein LHK_00961 [Laribacter hongkongensis HLHK9]|uniref:Uncharacterized protein n=2 Tax=Laribacter hongkongensis TaxID=168471 RepID=C1D5D6_LARHH|nr:hypothetical protein LHK_00961 [Laribacter hongkongensis HLHK9]ASJ23911.1 hypothetical protein LHGZ1_1080 [Laribacter hongkongensis]
MPRTHAPTGPLHVHACRVRPA